MSVNYHRFVAEDVRQFAGNGKMRGVAAPLQQPRIVQDGRGGADRRDPPVRFVLAPQESADAWIGAQVFYSGATGQKQAVEGLGLHRSQQRVGMQRDTAAPGDMDTGVERGHGYFRSRAAQKIDGGDRFDFLKSFRQDCENSWHGVI